jgi:hypothetical protein
MALNSFAFDLCGEGRAGLATSNVTEVMITGIFDFLSTDIDKLSGMNASVVTSSNSLQEVSLGIKQFKANVNDRGSVDVPALENSLALS